MHYANMGDRLLWFMEISQFLYLLSCYTYVYSISKYTKTNTYCTYESGTYIRVHSRENRVYTDEI